MGFVGRGKHQGHDPCDGCRLGTLETSYLPKVSAIIGIQPGGFMFRVSATVLALGPSDPVHVPVHRFLVWRAVRRAMPSHHVWCLGRVCAFAPLFVKNTRACFLDRALKAL